MKSIRFDRFYARRQPKRQIVSFQPKQVWRPLALAQFRLFDSNSYRYWYWSIICQILQMIDVTSQASKTICQNWYWLFPVSFSWSGCVSLLLGSNVVVIENRYLFWAQFYSGCQIFPIPNQFCDIVFLLFFSLEARFHISSNLRFSALKIIVN